jgi:hypothetical protein
MYTAAGACICKLSVGDQPRDSNGSGGGSCEPISIVTFRFPVRGFNRPSRSVSLIADWDQSRSQSAHSA